MHRTKAIPDYLHLQIPAELILAILVGGEKNFEHFLISKPKQIAVAGTTPALLVNCRDGM